MIVFLVCEECVRVKVDVEIGDFVCVELLKCLDGVVMIFVKIVVCDILLI